MASRVSTNANPVLSGACCVATTGVILMPILSISSGFSVTPGASAAALSFAPCAGACAADGACRQAAINSRAAHKAATQGPGTDGPGEPFPAADRKTWITYIGAPSNDYELAASALERPGAGEAGGAAPVLHPPPSALHRAIRPCRRASLYWVN